MPCHHPGNSKGPRMITEILRLRDMKLGTGKIAKALSISRNVSGWATTSFGTVAIDVG